MPDTIIFDLDGTLIDTEKYYRICWPQAARELGYEMSDEMALELRSLGRPYSPRKFAAWYGSEECYWKIRERRSVLVAQMIEREGLSLKPGALEILTWLREQGITIAMATANGPDKTRSHLDRLGLTDYFDKIICATMVEHGKPSPEVYAYACKELGKDPADCYAVEDSPNGVLSAAGAGCKVLMIPDQTEPGPELMQHLTARLDSLTDIMTFWGRG